MADAKSKQVREMTWDEEKKAFSREVFKEVLDFMKKDNAIIGDFSTITGVLANYLKENPSEIMKLNQIGGLAGQDPLDVGDVSGAGFGDKLWEFIERVIIADKEMIINLIGKIFGL